MKKLANSIRMALAIRYGGYGHNTWYFYSQL